MKNKKGSDNMKAKTTKSALLTSAMALLLCFAMLLGTTFAWFTDTASTAVNKIQAGNLDIQLLDAPEGNSLEGKTLKWKTADGRPQENILWEPGCTYDLQPITIKNAGNLNLKYKIVINGIQGDAPLNNAIEWTINDTALDADHPLAPGAYNTLTIQGHMREDAGNEYQGLSIDGIAITVVAAQQTGEYDSTGNNYDADAGYVKKDATIISEDNGKSFTLEPGHNYTVGNAYVAVAANGDITYTNTNSGVNTGTGGAQTVSIYTDGGTLTVNAPNDTVNHYGESGYVKVTAVANNSFHEFGKVTVLSAESGRVVIENGNNVARTQVKGTAVIAVPNNVVLATKIEAAGVTEIKVQKGSETPITVDVATGSAPVGTDVPSELEEVIKGEAIQEAKDYVARIGNEPYESLAAAVEAAQSGDTITLLQDVNLNSVLQIGKSVTINGNGYKLNVPQNGDRVININENTESITLTLKDLDVVGPTTGTYTRGVSAWKNSAGLKLILDNCTVSANYYALNIAGENQNVEVTVKNSTLTGWCAAQTWSAGTKATFENCTLIGNNDKGYNADGWNDFATIVINTDAPNTELTFKNCRIEANQTTGNKQYLLSVRASGAKVSLDDCTFFSNGVEISDEALGSFISLYSAASDLVLTIDGTVIPIN